MVYACLKYFIGANKLIAAGNRTYMNKQNAMPLRLQDDDEEGQLIQTDGVMALIYSENLWDDVAAITARMRETNAYSAGL